MTELGLTYSLLTEHTSFVAVQEEVRSFAGQATPVKHLLPLPQGVGNSAVGGQAPAGKHSVVVGNVIPAGGGSTSVPEPSSVFLILIAALLGLLHRHRQ